MAIDREEILDAAEVVFANSGLQDATVDAIASEAGISRRTIYRYFDNRDALLLGVILREADKMFDDIKQEIASFLDVGDQIVHAILTLSRAVPSNDRLAMLIADERDRTEVIRFAAMELFVRFDAFFRPLLEGAPQLRYPNNLDGTIGFISLVAYSRASLPEIQPSVPLAYLKAFLLPAIFADEP